MEGSRAGWLIWEGSGLEHDKKKSSSERRRSKKNVDCAANEEAQRMLALKVGLGHRQGKPMRGWTRFLT